MANTGVTTFAEVATFMAANPGKYTNKSVQCVNKIDSIMPYMYDAYAAIVADTSTYPTQTILDIAVMSAVAVIGRSM